MATEYVKPKKGTDPKAMEARRAELMTYTPEQYNAILNDPAYADLFKYGGINRPKDYTADSLKIQAPTFNVPGGATPMGLNAQSRAWLALQLAGRQTPEELRAQYEQQLKDPLTGAMIGYNKYYTDDIKAPKAGSSVVGGAHYGGDYDPGSPWNIEFGHMRANQQKQIASTPGSILQDMGIDRNNPQAEALLKAQMDKFMKENPDHIITKAMTSDQFGRKDGKSYGYTYFDKKYPGMSYMDKVDAAIRGIAGQNALPPRGIELGILEPLLQIAAGAINPWLGAAIGATIGGVNNGPLGALTGGVGGYGMGNLGSGLSSFVGNVARDGLSSTLGSMASDFGGKLANIAEHPFDYAKDAIGFGNERTAGLFGNGTLTNINVPGIMPLDIVGRAEPILHTLEPFIPAAYAGRGVTQAGLLASEPLRNVNQFMPPDIAARAGTSSVFPAGPPTLEQLAGRGGDAVEPSGSPDMQRPRLPSFGGGGVAAPSAMGGGLEFGQTQPIMKREFMPLYQGDYGTLQGLLQQQANQTLSNLSYAPRTRPGQQFLNSYTSGLLG